MFPLYILATIVFVLGVAIVCSAVGRCVGRCFFDPPRRPPPGL